MQSMIYLDSMLAKSIQFNFQSCPQTKTTFITTYERDAKKKLYHNKIARDDHGDERRCSQLLVAMSYCVVELN